jgi:lactate racemase
LQHYASCYGSQAVQAPQHAAIRWAAWYGDSDLALEFPAGWEVTWCPPQDAEDVGDEAVVRALREPIATAPLAELAAGRRSPCIVVDDLSRPTPADRIVPAILDELAVAGIAPRDVLVLMGIANHRPMERGDLLKKLGPRVLEECRVVNHDSSAGCRPVGTTSRGTPVEINAQYLEADLRLLVGAIIPHAGTGYSGGAKLLLPGVASLAAAEAFHRGPAAEGRYADVGVPARLDAEEAARIAGVDAIVNVVPTSRRGIAGIFVGDVVDAHRAGAARAAEVFATPDPGPADVCVLSLYPKDAEWLQHLTAFAPYRTAGHPLVRQGGTVVVALSGTEGTGFHGLFSPGRPLAATRATRLRERDLVFFSPALDRADIPPAARDETVLHRTWEETVAWLTAKHGPSARVSVFPCATTQLARD